MPRPRRFFAREYKAEVVELIQSTGKTVGQVASGSAKPTWTPAAAAMG